MEKYQTFCNLHHSDEAFLLGNAWDAGSAKLFEKLGCKAVATSSAAVANALGYEDGEHMSFDELFFVVQRIINAVSVPLSVDMERGYGQTLDEVTGNIKRLYEIGVVGMNIEDSFVSSKHEMVPVNEFAAKIEGIKNYLVKHNMNFFINLRTDAFLIKGPNPLLSTLSRLKDYERAGADCIFVPFIYSETDIQAVVSATRLPLNVLCMPSLPTFKRLSELGVKRISVGSFAYNSANRIFEEIFSEVMKTQKFTPLFKD